MKMKETNVKIRLNWITNSFKTQALTPDLYKKKQAVENFCNLVFFFKELYSEYTFIFILMLQNV